MNRIRKLTYELIGMYHDKFTVDFQANKEFIEQVTESESKYVRNKIAGYVTRVIRKEKQAAGVSTGEQQ
ncbi:MAG: 30S ribosomal protein S17e [Nitrososphaerota archaeon]|jgi:small subunit ribosomal protein S17e|nr:30S ribosomal protein S17e [Nitrososphaerota archaeon]MDG6927911.1 30S ribosomal protein S17e [Nitrososphaerota archaeon]MDG6930112.1 30S ribosomal protein S17e [Nitrososphaerota archaeon]MDG6932555.1 30S ribosomal protein S17e [Nitrososphaerota archaeon]MDG6935280.1 30S ribosomal protein S17e [Nitrososphaerota archaeon]